jgi:hypothetical protein
MIMAFIANWPWPTIGKVATIGLGALTLAIVFYVNIVRPRRRRRRLKNPFDVYFVIPPNEHHECEYAIQDNEEHFVKKITLPAYSETIVDFSLQPRMFFSCTEIYIGCDDNPLGKKPYATQYNNRFIKEGEGKVVKPGPGSSHYIDKHHLYHATPWPRAFSVGMHFSAAFTIRTNEPGIYVLSLYFPGDEVRGVVDDLILDVEERPETTMRCLRPEHRRKACAKRNIKPRSNSNKLDRPSCPERPALN